MTFVITRTNQDEEQQEDSDITITPRDEAQDDSFSIKRDVIAPAIGFGSGGAGAAIEMLGGGSESVMNEDSEKPIDQLQSEYDNTFEEMKMQGATDDTILDIIGNRPKESDRMKSFDEMTGGEFIPRNPRQRMLQKGAETAGEFVAIEALMPGASTAKALSKGAMTGSLFGTGEQIAEESGGGAISKFAMGATLASAPYLLSKSSQLLKSAIEFGKGLLKDTKPTGTPKFLSEVGTEKAMADLELSNRDLTGRVAKTSNQMTEEFDQLVGKVAKPAFEDVGSFRAADIEKQLITENQKAILDTIIPSDQTQKESWKALQDVVNGNFKAAKKSYTQLYDAVEETSKGLDTIPRNTHKVSSNLYEKLEKSLVNVPEEQGIRKALQDVVKLLEPMSKGNLVSIPLERLMQGKRSINRLLQKSSLIPAPVDLLKPVVKAMTDDILVGLEARPSVKTAFEAAESIFKKTQDVFNNEAMVKMRKSELPEKLTGSFTTPSNLDKLKKATGDNATVENFIDRLVVENIANKSKAVAGEMANEIKSSLGNKGEKALDKILEYGDNLTSAGQQSIARKVVLEDLQKAYTNSIRPDATLKMMKSKTGYNLVKDSLSKSPNGKKMFKSLQRMTFEDMMSSVIGKEGQIDFEKAKDILSNDHYKHVVKEALGESGLKFFNNLEQYGKNIAENLKKFANRDPNFFEKIKDNYLDKGLKYIMYALAPSTFGATLAPLLGVELGSKANKVRLFRILEDKKAQGLLKEMSIRNTSPKKMAQLLKNLSNSSREDVNE